LDTTKAPLIGIPCRYDLKRSYYELRQNYSDAIYAAGGCPILLPLIPHREYIDSIAARIDGICLSGSASDIDPIRYGEQPHPKLGPVLPRRDNTDLLLLEEAERRKLPVLAICFGAQSLNVSRGGTLIQDITSQVTDAVKHAQDGDPDYRSHSIVIAPGSVLEEIIAATSVSVNSHHHQAIKDVGRNLKPIAWAADGVVEAVADVREDRFVLGVQWHPEMGWESDDLSRAIFGRFVASAAKSRDERDTPAEVVAGN
jgi:putative glutamine amidotransferase